MRRPTILALAAALALAATGCLANEDNTGDDGAACITEHTGDLEITTGGTPEAPLVLDHLCVTDGVLIIDADYVTVTNARLNAAPPAHAYPIFVDDGHHGIKVDRSTLDCDATAEMEAQAIGIYAESGAKALDPTLPGYFLDVRNNEVVNCTDGFQLASNSFYSTNLIHEPAHPIGAHEDGVQFSAEEPEYGGGPIHDTTFEWNVVNFPASSSSFQFHTNLEHPEQGPYNLTVRYNQFRGGAGVVRVPMFTNGGGNAFYGNRIGALPGTFFLCTSATGEGTGAIEVWGRETGSTTNSLGDTSVLDDDNVNEDTGAIIGREDCL